MRVFQSASHRAFPRLLLAATLVTPPATATAAPAASGAASHPRGEEKDAHGRVVRTADGERRFHDGPDGAAVPVRRHPRVESVPELAAPGGDLALALEWYRPVMGYAIGLGGIEVADLDGDGNNEIVALTDLDTWKVVARQGAGYDQVWASLPSPVGIDALRVTTAGDERVVVLAYANGSLQLVAGDSRAPFRTIATGASEIRGLTIANVDGDSQPEALFCDPDQIFTVDLQTSAVSSVSMACLDLAVGQVDDEPGLEMAVATPADPAYVLDAATGAIEWTNNLGFGDQVEAGDLDGDGRDEVAAGKYWYDGITVFNVETHSIAYTKSIFNLAVLKAVNADADAPLELLYGDAQWGQVHVLNGADGAEDWFINNPEHGVTGIAFGNVDQDPAPEVLWGAGYSSSGPDYLYVGDGATHLEEWHSVDLSEGFYALGGADVDGDGGSEVYYGAFTSNSGYDNGHYFVHDGVSKAIEHDGPFDITPGGWGELWRMTTADAVGDEEHEIFLAGSRLYDGKLVCRDLAGAQLWAVTGDTGTSFRGLDVRNVDGDSHLEVVASVGVEHTGATGVSLYVYDAQDGALEWKSPNMGLTWNGYSLLRVAQVDGDAALETILGGIGGRVWVWDMQSHLEQTVTLNLDVSSLDVADVEGDGQSEVFIGTSAGLIREIDVATGNPTTVLGPVGGNIESLRLHDFTGDGQLDYLFAKGSQLEIRDGVDGTVRWTSGVLASYFVAINDTLRIGDFDDDGESEILAGLSRGVVMFGDDARDGTLLRDGFESGTTFKWSKSP
jgi:hypothetical protein